MVSKPWEEGKKEWGKRDNWRAEAKSRDLIPFPLLLLKCQRCDKNEIGDAKQLFF